MTDVLPIVIPIIALFLLGLLLRQLNLFTKQDANSFIRLAFFVSLPAIILNTIPKTTLSLEFLFLAILAVILISIMLVFSSLLARFWVFERETRGVFIIGPMILNLGFNVPFVLGVYGEEGFIYASFFDIGNLTMMLTLVYYLAQIHNSKAENVRFLNKRLLLSPPLLALIFAIAINILGISLDIKPIPDILALLGALVTPLLMIAIGLYFSPSSKNIVAATTVVGIRTVIGLSMGLIFIILVPMSVIGQKIVILSSAAPIGFNTLTFATLEDLDREFAANVVSIGIAVGIFMITVLLILMG
ncbi:MAG: AEC family transporter [Candidatus Heimdallarchaeota archaeon]